MQKIPIKKDDPLNEGDRIELHFNSIGLAWLTAAQISFIDWRLKNHKLFEVLNWQIPSHNTVIFTVEVKKTNPVLITAALIAGIIVVSGGGFLLFAKAFKIVMDAPAAPIRAATEFIKEPAGKLIAIGAVIVGVLLVGGKFLKK